MGLQARLMSQALRKLAGAINKSKTVLIFINQLRDAFGTNAATESTTITSNAPLLTSASVISNACSPVSGCDTIKVPRGRIIEIYGPESSGKTTLALHVIAEAQKTGGEAAL